MKGKLADLVLTFISFLDSIIPKKADYVVYNSYPDLSDNSFAIFLHILEHFPNKKNIWLIKSLDFKKAQAVIKVYSNKTNFKFVRRDSLVGIWYYLRSKYVFFTHGLFLGSKISKNHCVVNLWHGMPLKKIGLMDKSITPIKSTYAIASSSFYQKIIAESFGLNIDEVLPVGQPRIDLLYRKIDCLQKFKIKINENQRIILWTPTYRQSVVGDIRTDGNHTQDLPLIGRESLMELNIFLNDLNIFLLVKLHPMDKLNTKVFEEYSNIRILKNEDLEAVNVQLYSIMAEVDILLTDYSSIYIDFLYLKKPIAFIFEDIDSYTKSRGFVFSNPLDFMPGAIITNFEELKSFLDLVVNENLDYYKNNRQNLHEKLNSEFKNYSQQLLNAIDFI